MLDINHPDKSSWIPGHCKIPLSTILIDENGNIYLCSCQAYLPKILCNILDIQTREEFWNLFYNNEIRDSIIDKSHRFCQSSCSAIQSSFYTKKTNNFISYEELKNTNPYTLQLCIDNSCNLRCPTCRTETILHNNNFVYQKRLSQILEKIDMIFFKPLEIHNIQLLSGGEFLASKVITDWMCLKQNENIKFSLQTNGTLIYKNKEKCKNILNKTTSFMISIDAASKEVYEKTRLNGNWDNLIQGLDWLIDNFPKTNFTFNFTISALNYKDIGNFIKFSEKYNPRQIYFSRVEQWFDNPLLFKPLDIWNENHVEHAYFISLLRKVNFNQPNIRINFNDYLMKINVA
jgi:MoaA/NifB/PqqE/SkfB family radical SAM enzyme